MPGITLANAQARLADYLAAEVAVLAGQKYTIAGRQLERANLKDIQAGIDIWNRRVSELETQSKRGARAVVPRPNF